MIHTTPATAARETKAENAISLQSDGGSRT